MTLALLQPCSWRSLPFPPPHGAPRAVVLDVAPDDRRRCPQCTVAFFEYTDAPAQPFVNHAGVPNERAPQFDHLSLNLPDEQALHALRKRLQGNDWEVTDIVDHESVRSVYFTDPNGIALEASWWVRDPTGQPAGYHDPQHFADFDPVPAVVELQVTGTLAGARDSTRDPARTGN